MVQARNFAWVLSGVILALPCAAGEGDAAPGAAYLAVVRGYADAMIAGGTDKYGDITSPLFTSVLDRATLTIPGELPEMKDIRKSDRAYQGGNPMHDECFYQLLYELSDATGDARYCEAADASLKWFFEHAQSPATGLLAWGEHLYWDFKREAMGGNDNHEFYRPWVLYEASYRLAPETMARFAEGLWEHQIADHEAGLYSRHAKWSVHGPGTGAEFPRHGGFYIAQWAEAYKRTGREVYLTAIETLLDYFERVRHPVSLALPAINPQNKDDGAICWPLSQLSLAVDLGEGAGKVPESLGERMRATAQRNDVSFLVLPHDLSAPQGGFIAWARLDLSDVVNDELSQGHTTCKTWGTGYGQTTNAGAALLCYERYLQTELPQYRQLVLDAARLYLESDPDRGIELFPGALGEAICLLVAAHRLDAEPQFLARAQVLAGEAIGLFWDDGPLPRASTRTAHYETITRCDTLARSLLLLWGELNGRQMPTNYLDR
ncbi:MAG TPA: hypothetical protein PLJ71_12640 [Candidatus Hydrogenedentes bacterium]|mgnify:FL=1|nr:hypothetical protein [Candidatus Hydrogenedentota bacterium]